MKAFRVALFWFVAGLIPCRAEVGTQMIALNCMSCHRQKSDVSSADIPALDSLSEQQISQALLDFKYGRTQATLMPRIVKGYSDEELQKLAAYLASPVFKQ